MNKIIGIIVLILILISTHSTGQNRETLQNKLTTFPNDSSRIDSLNKWAYGLRYKDISLARFCANRARDLSVKSGNREGLALSYYRIALFYRKAGESDSAILFYHQCKNLWEKEKNIERIIHASNSLSGVFSMVGNYDSALYFGFLGLELASSIQDTINIARSHNKIAIIYEMTGDLNEAQEIYQKNLKIYKTISDNEGVAISLVNLGNIAFMQTEFTKAIGYYQDGLTVYEKAGFQHKTAGVYMNLGLCFMKNSNNAKALDYMLKSLELKEQYGQQEGVGDIYVNIGKLFEKQETYPKAIHYYKLAIDLAETAGDLDNAKSAWLNLYCVYAKQGDNKNALQSFIKYKTFQDSIFNLQKQELLTDYKTRYEVSQKTAENLRLENENLSTSLKLKNRTFERNTLVWGILSFLVAGLILILWYRSKTKKDKQIAQQKIQALQKEKDLLAAKYIVEGQEEERKRLAMELHDGVGVLLSTAKMQFTTFIRTLQADKPNDLVDKAYKLIDKASTEIRKVSYKMMPGVLAHFGLIEALKDLLSMVEDSTGIKTKIHVEGFENRLSEKMEVMIYRIFQELINNTVKHADASVISFHIVRRANNIELGYKDNGCGFDFEKSIRNKSQGLKNISSRIRFLHGEHKIETVEGKGFIFSSVIPLDKDSHIEV